MTAELEKSLDLVKRANNEKRQLFLISIGIEQNFPQILINCNDAIL